MVWFVTSHDRTSAFCLGREFPVQQQVAGLEEVALLGELLDRVAAVFEDTGIAVDIGDLSPSTMRIWAAGEDHSWFARRGAHQLRGQAQDDEPPAQQRGAGDDEGAPQAVRRSGGLERDVGVAWAHWLNHPEGGWQPGCFRMLRICHSVDFPEGAGLLQRLPGDDGGDPAALGAACGKTRHRADREAAGSLPASRAASWRATVASLARPSVSCSPASRLVKRLEARPGQRAEKGSAA
jgi:hypothetical protein